MVRILRLWCVFLLVFSLTSCVASKKEENTADVHYTLGLAYLQEQDPTRALKEFLLALEADPKRPDIHAALAQTYQRKEAYAQAEKHYLQALDLSNGDPQIQNNLAALYLDMQRWDDAIRYFQRASENLLFTNQSLALTGMGFAYAQKGNYLEAVSAYRKSLQQNPRYAHGHLLLGEAYYALDRIDLAVREFEEVLEIAPRSAQAHYQLGLALTKKGEKGKAAEHFREVLRLNPESDLARRAAENLKLMP